MSKQQTAVDWLFEKIIISSEHTDNINSDRLFFYRLYQQAKQMDKEQTKAAYNQGYRDAEIDSLDAKDGDVQSFNDAENYYTETYHP
jgi:hypothetical protein